MAPRQKKRTVTRTRYIEQPVQQPALQGSVNGIHIPGAWVAIAMQFIALLMVGAGGWQRLITTEKEVSKLEQKLENWYTGELVSREKFASLETKLSNVEKQLDKMARHLEQMSRQKFENYPPHYIPKAIPFEDTSL